MKKYGIALLFVFLFSVPAYANTEYATLTDESGVTVEVPVEIYNSNVSTVSGLMSATSLDKINSLDYCATITEADLKKLEAATNGHVISDSIWDDSGTVKLWGKIFYNKAIPNKYLVTRMQAATKIVDVGRVYINFQHVHVACSSNGWWSSNVRDFYNIDGQNFDESFNFSEYVEPTSIALIGGVVETSIKHRGNGHEVRLTLPLTIAGPVVVPPSGGK